jgi:anthranilate synthase component 2
MPVPPRRACAEGIAMLLMIDNYDSFTYNLVQYFGELGDEVDVVRIDEVNPAAPGVIRYKET